MRSPTRLLFALLMTALAGLFTPLATAAEPAPEPTIPILAWAGPPSDQTNVERYRELAAAGFTHNFSGFSSAAAVADALEVAKATGVKLFISLPELEKTPEEIAARFQDHPALGGYYLRDEPPASLFPQLAAWARRIQAVDPVHPCYINLFPNYADAGQLAVPTYQEYVNRFVDAVPVSFLSFDHYPVVGDALRGSWYENLEIVQAAAQKAGKPFWAFVLSVAHGPYPIPTVEQLRVQAFSDLAYGAQCIQYFTYWTPQSKEWDFHEGPIAVDGKRTPTYDRVRQVNEEIRGLSPVFLGAKVLQLGHTGPLPKGTHAYEPPRRSPPSKPREEQWSRSWKIAAPAISPSSIATSINQCPPSCSSMAQPKSPSLEKIAPPAASLGQPTGTPSHPATSSS